MLRKAVVGVVLVVAALAFGSARALAQDQPARAELTAEMKRDMGAAALAPANISVYSSTFNLARRCQQVWQSNAVQSLVALPFAQQLWIQVQKHPAYQGAVQQIQNNPLVAMALPVLGDMVSTEIFVCTGPDLPDVIAGCGVVLNKFRAITLKAAFAGKADAEPDVKALIEAVIQGGDRLRMPSVLFGFKLAKKQAASQLLDGLLGTIGPTPIGTVEKRQFGGGDFYVLDLKGDVIPPDALADLSRELTRKKLAPEKCDRFLAWIKGQRASVAIGILGDYLILSIGRDTSLLAQWGKGPSLAESPEFAPLRARFKPGLTNIDYASPELMKLITWTPDDVRNLATVVIGAIPEGPKTTDLKKRLRGDIDLLVKDLPPSKVAGELGFSFENKGIESFRLGGPADPALDYGKPLTILAHRGKRPIAASADRAPRDNGSYDLVTKWIGIAFGYFQDFAVPVFPAEYREDYEKVMRLAKPCIASFHQTTRELLLPAIDGAQSLMVLDGQGELTELPFDRPGPPRLGKLPRPIPIPRLALAIELNDAEKFAQAMARYADAVRKLLESIPKEYPKAPAELTLPPPQVADAAGGKLYSYPWPWALGRDVFPCALLKDRLLIVATSARLAEEMAEPVPMPASQVVGADQPAASVSVVDCREMVGLLRRLSTSVFALMEARHAFGPEEAPMAMIVKMHLDAVLRSLGAFRSYASTTTASDGRTVEHSWVNVEDVGP